jgi:hypothetical protein
MALLLALKVLVLAVVNTAVKYWINTYLQGWQHYEGSHIKHSILFSKGIYEYNKDITKASGLYLLGMNFLKVFNYINDNFLYYKLNHQGLPHLRYLNSALLGPINYLLIEKILLAKICGKGDITMKPEIRWRISVFAFAII